MAVFVATQAVHTSPYGYHFFVFVTTGSNTMVLIDVRRHTYACTASELIIWRTQVFDSRAEYHRNTTRSAEATALATPVRL